MAYRPLHEVLDQLKVVVEAEEQQRQTTADAVAKMQGVPESIKRLRDTLSAGNQNPELFMTGLAEAVRKLTEALVAAGLGSDKVEKVLSEAVAKGLKNEKPTSGAV